AEDGIRDFHVTGVQTCALPISSVPGVFAAGDMARRSSLPGPAAAVIAAAASGTMAAAALDQDLVAAQFGLPALHAPERAAVPAETGRAACRERRGGRAGDVHGI